ncbi:MAG: SGNH/GDSL hydrolase family protein [Bacteroidetes bacterium]|nr:SGNH/GDSL hydrolase family protein [Bacteroidota bacterium]
MKKSKIIIFNILLTFIIIEISLYTRLGAFLKVENNYLINFDTSNLPTQDKLLAYKKVFNKNSEFTTNYKANNEGFRNSNFDTLKNKYRIITIGDSFTEGIGATNDSTWQKQLNKIINQNSKLSNEIYNAGILGSDPIFEYLLLKTRLIKYKPDLVILTINDSDIYDIEVRGGFNRYNENNKLNIKKKPFWSFLLHSRLIRLINLAFYDFALTPRWKVKNEILKANKILQNAIDSTKLICEKHNSKLIVIFNPLQYEIDYGLEYKYKSTIEYCKKQNTHYVDVREEFKKMNVSIGYRRSRFEFIKSYLLNSKVDDSTKINGNQIYWKNDGHFNNKGYLLFANAIYPKVNSIINQK